jgi:hypothetical protein
MCDFALEDFQKTADFFGMDVASGNSRVHHGFIHIYRDHGVMPVSATAGDGASSRTHPGMGIKPALLFRGTGQPKKNNIWDTARPENHRGQQGLDQAFLVLYHFLFVHFV